MRKFFFVIVCLLFVNSYSQTKEADIIVGKSYLIKSEILNEEREIQVHLPPNYDPSSKKGYPVLYILDGQRLFLLGVSVYKSLARFQQSPEFIIVGIKNTYPHRFGHFSSGAKKFLNFIEKDIIHFVDDTFRTSNERLLFGWEYAGGFAIQSLITSPNLFNGIIASSPFPLNAPDLSIKDRRLKEIDSLLKANSEFKKSLYFSVGADEATVKNGTDELSQILSTKGLKDFHWHYRVIQEEEHRSTPFATLYQGLRTYYSYYAKLQFKNLEELLKAGGIPYVRNYYIERANQYGFSPEITRWTKFTIIRNAMRADSFSHFESFMKEFGTKEFIGELRINRACSIAEFYLKHQKAKKSLDLFSFLFEKNPNSQRVLKGLGDTYKMLKDTKKANFYYQKLDELKNK